VGPAFSWALALRYLTSRWVNVLGMLGVTVAVWALIVVRGIFSGFIADIRTDVRRSSPDLLVTGLPHETSFESLRAALLADAGVAAVAPRLRHYGVFYERSVARAAPSSVIGTAAADTSYVQLLGIDQERERDVTPFREWLDRGGRPSLRDPGVHGAPELGADLQVPDEIEYAARRRAGLPVPDRIADFRSLWPGMLLGRERLSYYLGVGDPLDVVSVDFARLHDGNSSGGPPSGAGHLLALQATFAFAGAFHTGAQLFDETTAIVPIEALRTMLGHDALDDAAVDLCTDVALRARGDASAAALQALAARLLPRVLAALPKPLPPEAKPEVLTWEQQNAVFLDAVDAERAMMTAVMFAVMLIAAFLIYATLHMMVSQKVKDIGILTALGGSPRGVGQIFTRCGLVIGVVGTTCGAAAGIAFLRVLNPLDRWMLATFDVALFPPDLFDLQEVPYRVETAWVVGFALGALVLTLVVAWLPARKAARMHPVEALSYE
jgi:lipoprotein-releasing system permease protein